MADGAAQMTASVAAPSRHPLSPISASSHGHLAALPLVEVERLALAAQAVVGAEEAAALAAGAPALLDATQRAAVASRGAVDALDQARAARRAAERGAAALTRLTTELSGRERAAAGAAALTAEAEMGLAGLVSVAPGAPDLVPRLAALGEVEAAQDVWTRSRRLIARLPGGGSAGDSLSTRCGASAAVTLTVATLRGARRDGAAAGGVALEAALMAAARLGRLAAAECVPDAGRGGGGAPAGGAGWPPGGGWEGRGWPAAEAAHDPLVPDADPAAPLRDLAGAHLRAASAAVSAAALAAAAEGAAACGGGDAAGLVAAASRAIRAEVDATRRVAAAHISAFGSSDGGKGGGRDSSNLDLPVFVLHHALAARTHLKNPALPAALATIAATAARGAGAGNGAVVADALGRALASLAPDPPPESVSVVPDPMTVLAPALEDLALSALEWGCATGAAAALAAQAAGESDADTALALGAGLAAGIRASAWLAPRSRAALRRGRDAILAAAVGDNGAQMAAVVDAADALDRAWGQGRQPYREAFDDGTTQHSI